MNLLCPNCSKILTVPEQYGGQHMRCPGCATRFTVPDLPAPASPPPSSSEPEADGDGSTGGPQEGWEVTVPGLPEGESAVGLMHILCPRCQNPLTVPRSDAGQLVKCPICAQRLAAQKSANSPPDLAIAEPPAPEVVPDTGASTEVSSFVPPEPPAEGGTSAPPDLSSEPPSAPPPPADQPEPEFYGVESHADEFMRTTESGPSQAPPPSVEIYALAEEGLQATEDALERLLPTAEELQKALEEGVEVTPEPAPEPERYLTEQETQSPPEHMGRLMMQGEQIEAPEVSEAHQREFALMQQETQAQAEVQQREIGRGQRNDVRRKGARQRITGRLMPPELQQLMGLASDVFEMLGGQDEAPNTAEVEAVEVLKEIRDAIEQLRDQDRGDGADSVERNVGEESKFGKVGQPGEKKGGPRQEESGQDSRRGGGVGGTLAKILMKALLPQVPVPGASAAAGS